MNTVAIILLSVAALLAAFIGLFLLLSWIDRLRGPRLTAGEMADQLQALVDATGWEEDLLWDEFTCVPVHDEKLDRFRERCIELSDDATRRKATSYFTGEQKEEVRKIIQELRQVERSPQPD